MPIIKLTLRNCQRLFTFCQSGEISPNLVTLREAIFLEEDENVTGMILQLSYDPIFARNGQSVSFIADLPLVPSSSFPCCCRCCRCCYCRRRRCCYFREGAFVRGQK